MKIKTIDISTLEWFDKVNGNTYFASEIAINFGLKTQKTLIDSFQYGYGSQSEFEAKNTLIRKKLISEDFKTVCLSSICEKMNIVLRVSKRKALQRELKALSAKLEG